MCVCVCVLMTAWVSYLLVCASTASAAARSCHMPPAVWRPPLTDSLTDSLRTVPDGPSVSCQLLDLLHPLQPCLFLMAVTDGSSLWILMAAPYGYSWGQM
jgi:hypothetical protein